MLSGHALGTFNCPDFLAGIPRKPLVHDVQKRGKIGFLLVFTVNSVINGDETDALLREENFCIKSNLQIVTTQPRHVFDNDNANLSSLNLCQHFLKPRALEICAGKSIVHKNTDIVETMILCVFGEQFLLERDLSRKFYSNLKYDVITFWNDVRMVVYEREK